MWLIDHIFHERQKSVGIDPKQERIA